MADSAEPAVSNASKISAQLRKLQEANAKYKNLLKLAKERIQQQEEELESVRQEKVALEEKLVNDEREAAKEITLGESDDRGAADEVHNIIRVCQRIKTPREERSSQEEIWALVESEVVPLNDMFDISSPKRYKEWKRFDTESDLQDFIRRDTGEPLTLPPYSLSPEQSMRIQQEASQQVSQVTEEFRRFRVRAELARKQADAQIRDLQNNQFQSAARRIEGQDSLVDMDHGVAVQLERMKSEMAAQEAHWKEAYDVLLAENNALKSAGSEALLASQWRQRYETCKREKEDLEEKLNAMSSSADQNGVDKYEAKYRDLKESFRLYRKKAKEIFEAQERGAVVPPMASSEATFNISDASSAEAKISYLKNLMVNYLSSDPTTKSRMETAIGTVLQFTPEEVERIEKKKAEHEAWF